MKILSAMLLLATVPLAGCTTASNAAVKEANARRNATRCVARSWMRAGTRHPGAGRIHEYAHHRDNYAVNPPPSTPNIGRIVRECQ